MGQVRTELHLALHVEAVHRMSYRGPSQAPTPFLTSRSVVAYTTVFPPPIGSSARLAASSRSALSSMVRPLQVTNI